MFEDTTNNPSKLTTIGYGAFSGNELSKIVIPSSVATIGKYAFSLNDNLSNVIIKNTEGNVTADSTAFPSTATITYDPNYTEQTS